MGISKRAIILTMIAVAGVVGVLVHTTNAQVQTCQYPNKCSAPAPITTPCPKDKVCLQ